MSAEETPSNSLRSGRRHWWRWWLVVALTAGAVGVACVRIIPEGHVGVVTRWGRPQRIVELPGPQVAWPSPMDRIHLLDVRRHLVDVPPTTVLTSDKKNVVITSFVVWRIADPLLFLQSAGQVDSAATQLTGFASAAMNQEISRRSLAALASLDANVVQLDDIEERLCELLESRVRPSLGVSIEVVGLRRVTLPRENLAAVLERMKAEREAEAGRVRSEGAKAAQAIRDEAHVQSQEVLRKGREAASRITAEAERKATEELAAAHSRDPEFYRFWSALEASKMALGKNSVVVLRSDRGFFESLLPAIPRDEVESLAPVTSRRSSATSRETQGGAQ
ncbi:MAG: protease modulator HflC [Pirellulales bacterium]